MYNQQLNNAKLLLSCWLHVLYLEGNKYHCTKNLIAPFSLSIYYNMPTTQTQDVETHTHTWPQSIILCPVQ